MAKRMEMNMSGFLSADRTSQLSNFLTGASYDKINIENNLAIIKTRKSLISTLMITLLNIGRIKLAVNDHVSISGSTFIIPVITDSTTTIVIDMTPYVQPSTKEAGTFELANTAVPLYDLLETATVAYISIEGLENERRYFSRDMEASLVTAYSNLTLPIMTRLTSLKMNSKDVLELLLRTHCFNMLRPEPATPEEDIGRMNTVLHGIKNTDLDDSTIQAIYTKLHTYYNKQNTKVYRKKFIDFYNEVITVVIPEFSIHSYTEVYSAYTAVYGVRSLNTLMYAPYLVALLVSSKSGYGLYSNRVSGAINEEGKLFYTSMTRRDDRVMLRVLRSKKK